MKFHSAVTKTQNDPQRPTTIHNDLQRSHNHLQTTEEDLKTTNNDPTTGKDCGL